MKVAALFCEVWSAVDVVSVQVDSVKEMDDIIQGLQQQVAFTQDNISDCQMSIMQMEENKVGWKVIRTTSVTDGGEQDGLEGHQDNISDWWKRTR